MADIYKKKLMSILGTRYDIDKKYAEGGMGKIYLGMHRTLGKPVAIKVIDQRFGGDDKMRKRFFKEAKLVANLTHKGIIDIYDFGSREDFDFLIMPFIDGETLSHKLKKEGRLSCSESLYIIQSVAEALAFAHKKYVVHRDIKPSNIMIDVQKQVILTDFGISKDLTDPEMTATGMILGSPRYMSPEQALGRPVDGRSDLYSLGLVFYEMVTGQYPYEDKGTQALLYMQAHELPPKPDQIVSDLPEQVSAIIIKLLRKSPKHRYQTGEELIRDLLRCGSANYPIETAALETDDPAIVNHSNETTITERHHKFAETLFKPVFIQSNHFADMRPFYHWNCSTLRSSPHSL
ncbi:MAG: serine/threonine protein kinase [Deltaproteobacteria bacterium]|nr:serine/threonine protein kinase [Deltaproteobacteria bacterium]